MRYKLLERLPEWMSRKDLFALPVGAVRVVSIDGIPHDVQKLGFRHDLRHPLRDIGHLRPTSVVDRLFATVLARLLDFAHAHLRVPFEVLVERRRARLGGTDDRELTMQR